MNPISDLYTRFMEWIMPFLTQHWQLFIIFVGVLFLVGAICRWRWVCNPQGENPMGFNAFVYRNFGEKGYRVIIGISSSVIILCGLVMWIMM